jgi:endonuclease/exonuclease/phosphatase family metal-dependent hydrolase
MERNINHPHSLVIEQATRRVRMGRTLGYYIFSTAALLLAIDFLTSDSQIVRTTHAFGTDQEVNEFSILSYNTHGLPAWIARDKPKIRFPIIGQKINAYDIAILQEDFAYHNLLLHSAVHPVIERGNGARYRISRLFTFLCGSCGSGLTTLSRFPRERLLRIDRKEYTKCAGWLGGGNDCWATKGFLRTQWQIANNVKIDIYNTHLDADDGPKDHQARMAQLNQLREYIEKQTGDGPLILGGDLNLDHDVSQDKALLDSFIRHLGLTDTQAQASRGSWPYRLDYLLFRSGGGISLELIDTGVSKEFVNDGKPLSDHPPLYARFRIKSGQ